MPVVTGMYGTSDKLSKRAVEGGQNLRHQTVGVEAVKGTLSD